TDMYLPALPTVARELSTSDAAAQFTLSGMLIGGAVGQLVIGPLSDRFGRRLPVLLGVAAHVVTSVLCMVAPNIATLIGLRVLQGFFNAAASVVAIAVIRDRFVGSEAARLLSRLMLVIGVAPMFAPTIGSFISASSSHTWRAVFAVLAVVGLGLLAVVWRFMPETLPAQRRRVSGPRGALAGYRTLLRDRHFMAVAVLPGLGMAVVMSYVVGSTFVLQNQYGLSEQQFAIAFAVNGVALVGSAQLNASLVRRIAPLRLLRAALVLQLVLGLVLLTVVLTGAGMWAMLAALFCVLGMQGMIPANASVIALGRFGHMAGTAAALMGAMQAGIAGVVSPIVGFLGGNDLAMVSVILGAIVVAIAVLAIATPAYRRGGAWEAMG
ncbi:MAG: multidrug effflux MFS transporter, partial [Cellulomonadaceae bacterium]